MSRSFCCVAALLAATALTAPALAADYDAQYPDFRESYTVEPKDWAGLGDEDDPLKLEFGIRYWYSIGAMAATSGGPGVTADDATHFGELHLRIEDHSTNTYAKANAGYSIASTGTFSSPSTTGSISDGHSGYIGADFGWNAFGDNNGSGAGLLVGYQYWHEGLNTGRNNFTTATSSADITYDPGTGQTFVPGDSATNALDMHLLRLGVQGKANLGIVDFTAEVAGIPYAKVNGTVGIDDPVFDDVSVYSGTAQFPYDLTNTGNIVQMRSSPTSLDGWGYGAAGEVWLGIHPVENMTFRVGGRAWYLQGTADATYNVATIGNPGDADLDGTYDTAPTFVNAGAISVTNPFSMFRYGLMAELTYAF